MADEDATNEAPAEEPATAPAPAVSRTRRARFDRGEDVDELLEAGQWGGR